MASVLVVCASLIFSVICLQLITSTELIPERVEIIYVNEKYLKNLTAYIRRTGRKSPYYIYIMGTSLEWFGNNISIEAVTYEYLHNEYKRSFVQVELNLCDIFHKQPWRSLGGAALEAKGIFCPIPSGTYAVHNLSVSMVDLPFIMPFEKFMLEWYAKLVPTQETVSRGRFYGTFKRDIPKGK